MELGALPIEDCLHPTNYVGSNRSSPFFGRSFATSLDWVESRTLPHKDKGEIKIHTGVPPC